jgi:hypothetical protein
VRFELQVQPPSLALINRDEITGKFVFPSRRDHLK